MFTKQFLLMCLNANEADLSVISFILLIPKCIISTVVN